MLMLSPAHQHGVGVRMMRELAGWAPYCCRLQADKQAKKAKPDGSPKTYGASIGTGFGVSVYDERSSRAKATGRCAWLLRARLLDVSVLKRCSSVVNMLYVGMLCRRRGALTARTALCELTLLRASLI